MVMTDEQKYSAVLKELGELLQSKNTTITCQRWQIDQLKEKLEVAEKERDNLRVELDAAIDVQRAEAQNLFVPHEEALLLDKNAIDVLRSVNAELRTIYENMASEDGNNEALKEIQGTIKSVLPIAGGAA